MLTNRLLCQFAAALAISCSYAPLGAVWAADTAKIALSGQVRSVAEGPMEGVVVSAHREGSSITVSVITNEKGYYSFPAGKLLPGEYDLNIRAAGYDLGQQTTAHVAVGTSTSRNIELTPTHDLAAQLTNAEWLMSIPGTKKQKTMLLDCQDCHTLERIVRSKHTASEWEATISRMRGYARVSFWLKPQLRPRRAAVPAGKPCSPAPLTNDEVTGDSACTPTSHEAPGHYSPLAAYLSTINLSSTATWSYPLKTLPRPKGRDTHVLITEYQLPRRQSQPHDVVVDRDGMVWYADFGGEYLGKLDPASGRVTEYPIKADRPGSPEGNLDLEVDPSNGTLWFDMMYQAGVGNFNQKTETFTYYLLPKEMASSASQLNFVGIRHDVDNKVWVKRPDTMYAYQIDLATGTWRGFDIFKGVPDRAKLGIYGALADSHNNFWLAEYFDGRLGRIDAQTGEISWYPAPQPRSGIRRMDIDSQDVIAFAEYRGNKIGTFDTNSRQFTAVWDCPPGTYPYRAVWDKSGEIWASSMSSDRVVRFNPQTGKFVQYLLPLPTNMRSGFIVNTTPQPTYWIGSNHGASILKVEPLD